MGERNATERQLSEIGCGGSRLQQGDLMVVPESLQKGCIAIVVATSENESAAVKILLHYLKDLPNLVISLLLAITNVDERKERLGATKATGKFCKGGSVIGVLKGARVEERLGQAFDTENDLDKNFEMRIVILLLEASLNFGKKLVRCSTTALFALGNKILAKHGPVAVDDDIGERG